MVRRKLISCLRGSVYDVLIDLRPNSPTYREWLALELSARCPGTANRSLMLYAPEGFAYGFQTLEDDTEVLYQMSAVYDPASARGMRWNDPAFAIQWPDAERIISPRDQNFLDFVLYDRNK